MEDMLESIVWEAPEHHHEPKKEDWFWVCGIITIATTVAALLLNNTLLGILLLLGGITVALLAARPAKLVEFAVTNRGVRIDSKLYPYTTLESFCITEHPVTGPRLLLKSTKLLMPLLVLPLPEEYTNDIEDLVASRLPEEHLEEPLATKLLEFFGF